MRRHAKASTAGSTQRQAGRLGRFFRGAFATRDVSSDSKGSGVPSVRRLAIPVGVLAALLALILVGPAGASKTHLFEETFGSAAQPSFGNAGGMAVDQSSGDVLVIDAGAETVSRYNPDGTAANFSGLGTNVIDGKGNGECATVPADCDQTPQNGFPGFGGANEMQVAVDNSGGATDGNIYVTQVGAHLLDIFSAEGKYLDQLTESSTGPFGETCGVAVDPSGNLYVGDFSGKIHKFVPAANPPVKADNTASFTTAANSCTLAAGVGPTAGFIFSSAYFGVVSKIDSSTGELKYVVSPGSNTTVSVDPATGHVYAAMGSEIKEFDASGAGSATAVANFPLSSSARGVAVGGGTGNVYVSRSGESKVEVFGPVVTVPDVSTGSASSIDKTTATLNGTVNPDGVALSECKFEYGTTPSYGQSVPCAETTGAIGSGTSAVPVHADVSGLTEGGLYHLRLVAKNANDTVNGSDSTFTTLSPPVIAAEWSEGVVRTEATLKGEINPKNFATTYRFEWGTSTSYGEGTAESAVGSDNANHIVTHALTGLQPGTIYHYRIVATSSVGITEGTDHTFTTFAPVSLDTNCPNQAFRTGSAAQLPNCRAYEMVSPVDKNGGDIVALENSLAFGHIESLYQSALNGEKFTYSSYRAFANAVSAPYISQYIASRGTNGWSSHALSAPRDVSVKPGLFVRLTSEFKALSPDLSSGWVWHDSEAPPLAPGGVPGGQNLYKWDAGDESYTTASPGALLNPSESLYDLEFQGASKDGTHAVFRASAALTPEAPPGQMSVYEWYNGELRLVSRLPNGTPVARDASAGSAPDTTTLDGHEANVIHAISDDGSRIFWTGEAKLYVRINGTITVPISDSVSPTGGSFWMANPDGSKVIFTSSPNAALYEFDVDSETPTLIAPEVIGVAGASEDTSYVYFVSRADLDSGATEGEANLYLYHEGMTSFVGSLAGDDLTPPIASLRGAASLTPFGRTTRVTPDGRHIAFMSSRSLAGYDNTDAVSGEPDSEVYIYGADTKQLTCVSCNPSGERPVGRKVVTSVSSWIAASIPDWETQLHASRILSDNGNRLFFHSIDPLVLQDSNGVQDVYEWEAQGTGSCQKPGGCVSLISSGQSSVKSEIADASPSGNDIFIRTDDSLLQQDPGLIDVYDARVNGGFPPPPPPPPPCLGDACQGAPEPPNDPTPASASFHGSGDPTPKTRSRCRARGRHAGKRSNRAKHKSAKRCKRANRRTAR